MRWSVPFLVLMAAAASYAQGIIHSYDTDDELRAIIELGAATNWNFNSGATVFVPNLAAECTPIEDSLELRAGG